jgi:hypothetical protein
MHFHGMNGGARPAMLHSDAFCIFPIRFVKANSIKEGSRLEGTLDHGPKNPPPGFDFGPKLKDFKS